MSCPSGFKGWTAYLWMLHASSNISADEMKEMLGNGLYEEAAEKLLNDLGKNQFNEKLHVTYRTGTQRAINGPLNYLPHIFRRVVITTNFDNLLERVYKDSGNVFERTLLGRQGESLLRHMTENTFCLYKLHGDYAEPATRVLTKREYDAAYADGAELSDTLKYIFRTNKLLFLGCGLMQDRTMQLMQTIAKGANDNPHHYAFLEAPADENERKDRQKLLAARCIFPVWYPTGEHDSSIEALFVKMLSDLNAL